MAQKLLIKEELNYISLMVLLRDVYFGNLIHLIITSRHFFGVTVDMGCLAALWFCSVFVH